MILNGSAAIARASQPGSKSVQEPESIAWQNASAPGHGSKVHSGKRPESEISIPLLNRCAAQHTRRTQLERNPNTWRAWLVPTNEQSGRHQVFRVPHHEYGTDSEGVRFSQAGVHLSLLLFGDLAFL